MFACKFVASPLTMNCPSPTRLASVAPQRRLAAAWVRDEEYSGMGGDGTLSLLELAFFLHKQRCLPEFFVPAA